MVSLIGRNVLTGHVCLVTFCCCHVSSFTHKHQSNQAVDWITFTRPCDFVTLILYNLGYGQGQLPHLQERLSNCTKTARSTAATRNSAPADLCNGLGPWRHADWLDLLQHTTPRLARRWRICLRPGPRLVFADWLRRAFIRANSHHEAVMIHKRPIGWSLVGAPCLSAPATMSRWSCSWNGQKPPTRAIPSDTTMRI
jgi:hypothetical protein